MENFPKIGEVNEAIKGHLESIAIQCNGNRAGLCVIVKESARFLRIKECWIWPEYTNIAPGALLENIGCWNVVMETGSCVITNSNQLPECWMSTKSIFQLYDIEATMLIRLGKDTYFFLDSDSPKPGWDSITLIEVTKRITPTHQTVKNFYPLSAREEAATIVAYLETHPNVCEEMYQYLYHDSNQKTDAKVVGSKSIIAL